MSRLERTTAQQEALTQQERRFLHYLEIIRPILLSMNGFHSRDKEPCHHRLAIPSDRWRLLGLVPPEILRYLIASTKPKKAITFDAGMSLVELADEYERLLSRDLESEMNNETYLGDKRSLSKMLKEHSE